MNSCSSSFSNWIELLLHQESEHSVQQVTSSIVVHKSQGKPNFPNTFEKRNDQSPLFYSNEVQRQNQGPDSMVLLANISKMVQNESLSSAFKTLHPPHDQNSISIARPRPIPSTSTSHPIQTQAPSHPTQLQSPIQTQPLQHQHTSPFQPLSTDLNRNLNPPSFIPLSNNTSQSGYPEIGYSEHPGMKGRGVLRNIEKKKTPQQNTQGPLASLKSPTFSLISLILFFLNFK